MGKSTKKKIKECLVTTICDDPEIDSDMTHNFCGAAFYQYKYDKYEKERAEHIRKVIIAKMRNKNIYDRLQPRYEFDAVNVIVNQIFRELYRDESFTFTDRSIKAVVLNAFFVTDQGIKIYDHSDIIIAGVVGKRTGRDTWTIESKSYKCVMECRPKHYKIDFNGDIPQEIREHLFYPVEDEIHERWKSERRFEQKYGKIYDRYNVERLQVTIKGKRFTCKLRHYPYCPICGRKPSETRAKANIIHNFMDGIPLFNGYEITHRCVCNAVYDNELGMSGWYRDILITTMKLRNHYPKTRKLSERRFNRDSFVRPGTMMCRRSDKYDRILPIHLPFPCDKDSLTLIKENK